MAAEIHTPALTPPPLAAPPVAHPSPVMPTAHPVGLASHRVPDRSVRSFRLPPLALPYAGRTARDFRVTVLGPDEFPIDGLVEHQLGKWNVFFGTRNGQSVAVFRHKGRGYHIVANMPIEELQGMMVRTALYR